MFGAMIDDPAGWSASRSFGVSIPTSFDAPGLPAAEQGVA